MRYLVVSDVHSNGPALEAVLYDAPAFDALICLGDIVGYGPDPNECVSRLGDYTLVCLAGNHDWGAIGKADLLIFNREARHALLWTQGVMRSTVADFLKVLPPTQALNDSIVLAHGSPRDPVWEYLVDGASAARNFEQCSFKTALVGHSHLPLVHEWLEAEGRVRSLRAEVGMLIHLDDRRLILNPGSVGQPRDGDPRASYALLDMDAMTWSFRRVSYPVAIAQERMRAQALPQRLIDRLDVGR
jgi:predicted phosphodiesterase